MKIDDTDIADAPDVFMAGLRSSMVEFARAHHDAAMRSRLEPLIALETFLKTRLNAEDFGTAGAFLDAADNAVYLAFEASVGQGTGCEARDVS